MKRFIFSSHNVRGVGSRLDAGKSMLLLSTANWRWLLRLLALVVLIGTSIQYLCNSKVSLLAEQDEAKTESDDRLAAICHRALFGNVNVSRVVNWVRYNHQLGFNHIFLWYLPAVQNYSGFAELRSLPFVTLTEEDLGNAHGGWKNVVEEHESQRNLMMQCLHNEARGYEWVMFVDADEFLWFDEKIQLDEFLDRHANYTYLSFGKKEYTVNHATNTINNGFDLDMYPFTAGSYCRPPGARNPQSYGSTYCPANRGRSKVMLKPAIHNYTDIHGITKRPNPKHGMLHFDTCKAHFKEWIGIHTASPNSTTIRNPSNFLVRKQEEVTVHQLKRSFKANENGTYTMIYDENVSSWFEFVVSI